MFPREWRFVRNVCGKIYTTLNELIMDDFGIVFKIDKSVQRNVT